MPQGDRHQSKLLNRIDRNLSLRCLCKTLISTAISLAAWGHLQSLANSPISLSVPAIATAKWSPSQRVYLVAQDPTPPAIQSAPNSIDLSPELLNSSPVLQKWLKGIPNVMDDINNDPSFRTRVKIGYSQYPSTGQSGGFHLAIDDVFLGRSGLSASANYDATFNGNRSAYGADAQYYLLPLGGYINITPLVGFRHLQTDKYNRDGLNLGLKLMLIPSRGGGADIALSQSWVGLGSSTETGLTTLSLGYALTNHLRLSTDIQQQNARESYDSRVGVGVEWMP